MHYSTSCSQLNWTHRSYHHINFFGIPLAIEAAHHHQRNIQTSITTRIHIFYTDAAKKNGTLNASRFSYSLTAVVFPGEMTPRNAQYTYTYTYTHSKVTVDSLHILTCAASSVENAYLLPFLSISPFLTYVRATQFQPPFQFNTHLSVQIVP